jgi:hypothetical protein
VRSRLGAARTILLLHTISARPSKQPRMVGSTLAVYSFALIFVSARTNKRHHHKRMGCGKTEGQVASVNCSPRTALRRSGRYTWVARNIASRTSLSNLSSYNSKAPRQKSKSTGHRVKDARLQCDRGHSRTDGQCDKFE